MVEFSTTLNLALLYLLYCYINRLVRDKSMFHDIDAAAQGVVNLNKNSNKFKNSQNTSILQEDVPVLKTEGLDLKLGKPTAPEIKIETSFDGKRIGAYK